MAFALPARTAALPASIIRGAVRWSVIAVLLLCSPLLQGQISTAGADEYRLTAGDTLSFDFLDDALPAEQLSISGDGRVSVPLLGAFNVAGLTIPEALAAIRSAFIERQIFIEPKVSLSVASFRPIFVLGDVKAPGAFPFQPLLTVEQAVALAGGHSMGSVTTEDRVVTRARLRGNLEESEVEIAREAVAAARLTAQLAGRATISDDDLPSKTRPIVRPELLGALLPTERQILSAEQHAFDTRRDQLAAAIVEVEGALANLEQLAQKQMDVIASAKSEVDRAKKLNDRGLKTLTDLSNVERDATAQEAHLLEVYNNMSTTRRELGELQRQFADLTNHRTRLALSELQAHAAEIERLLAARTSIEEQILLLGSLAAEAERKAGSMMFTYQIRRKVDGQWVTSGATLNDAVLSGDTVLVAVADARSVEAPLARAALFGAQR